MKTKVTYLVACILHILLTGCTTPGANTAVPINVFSEISEGADSDVKYVYVMGFVKNPEPYKYKNGMTISDALSVSGGIATCEHCTTPIMAPVRVTRDGHEIRAPKETWNEFKLKENDVIKFAHIRW